MARRDYRRLIAETQQSPEGAAQLVRNVCDNPAGIVAATDFFEEAGLTAVPQFVRLVMHCAQNPDIQSASAALKALPPALEEAQISHLGQAAHSLMNCARRFIGR